MPTTRSQAKREGEMKVEVEVSRKRPVQQEETHREPVVKRASRPRTDAAEESQTVTATGSTTRSQISAPGVASTGDSEILIAKTTRGPFIRETITHAPSSSEKVMPPHRYSLRSASPSDDVSILRTRASTLTMHTTVTPGTATKRKNPLHQKNLPEGVADIFSELLTPPEVHNEQEWLRLMAHQHIIDYGEEYCTQLREREEHQWKELLRFDDIMLRDNDQEDRLSVRTPESIAAHCNHQDSTCIEKFDYLSFSEQTPLPRQPHLTVRMRRILVNWMSEISMEFKISHAALHLAISLLDYVLTMGPPFEQVQRLNQEQDVVSDEDDEEGGSEYFTIQKNDFQAVGCACILIASKVEDIRHPRVEELVYISDSSFSADYLIHLETRICNLLQFRLQKVTPHDFLHVYLRASQASGNKEYHPLKDNSVLQNMALYLLELSRSSYLLSREKPSMLAASSIFLARATLHIGVKNSDEGSETEMCFWNKTLQHYSGYSISDMIKTLLQLHRLQLCAEKSPEVGVTPAFNKFRRPETNYASLKTAPRVEDLGIVTSLKHNDINADREDHSVPLVITFKEL